MTATETTEQPDALPTTTPLLARDRCDKGACGAQAQVRYLLAFSGVQFCAHHANDNHTALTAQGFTIDQDLRKGLK